MILKNNSNKAKSIVEHIIYEFWGKGNLKRHEELIAFDVSCHCPKSWEIIHNINVNNRTKAKVIDLEYAKAFQFKKVEISNLIIEQDKVSVRWSSEGIHQADFFNIKKSNQPFHLSGQTIYQFNKKEQIGAVWQAWDMLGLLAQIEKQQPFVNCQSTVHKWLKLAELLSRQEKECLKYFLEGKTAKETAMDMKLSFRTIEYYFENIKNKLSCHRKRELIACARLLEKHRLL